MALNISAWSIRNPLPSVVFSIVLLVLGWVSFTKLAVTRLPSADIPVISVAVSQFGAAPAELESQVTKTIEDGVSGVEGVRHISSSITDGLSLTTIQFALETNTDRALNDVKDAVTRVRANLPQNVNEPLIQRVDVIGLPIVTYAAISPGKTPEQLSYFVDDVVKRALQGVRNVAQVERIGGVEREILVSLDPDRLQAAGLTAVNVSQSLRGTNVDLAGGRAEIGKNDQAIRTLAGAKTLKELAGTMIPLFSGGEVRLDDLGTVTDTIADRRTFARFNGEPVVALGIKRAKGASDVVVAGLVQKRINALKEAYPDVDLKLIDTSVEFTKGNYDAAIETLFEGAILAVVIVLLFLRDIRATVIADVAQEQQHDDDGKDGTLEQGLDRGVIIALGEFHRGVDQLEIDVRISLLERIDPLLHQARDHHVAGALGALDAERHHRLAVEAGEGPAVGDGVGDGTEIVEPDFAAGKQRDHGAGQFVQCLGAGQRPDRLVVLADLGAAAGEVDIGAAQALADIDRGEARGLQAIGIERNENLALDTADTLDLGDAADALEFAFDHVVDEIGQLLRRLARRDRGIGDDRQADHVDTLDQRLGDILW